MTLLLKDFFNFPKIISLQYTHYVCRWEKELLTNGRGITGLYSAMLSFATRCFIKRFIYTIFRTCRLTTLSSLLPTTRMPLWMPLHLFAIPRFRLYFWRVQT